MWQINWRFLLHKFFFLRTSQLRTVFLFSFSDKINIWFVRIQESVFYNFSIVLAFWNFALLQSTCFYYYEFWFFSGIYCLKCARLFQFFHSSLALSLNTFSFSWELPDSIVVFPISFLLTPLHQQTQSHSGYRLFIESYPLPSLCFS